MPHGQWVAFEGDQVHKCGTPVKRDTIAPRKPADTEIGEPFEPFEPVYPKISEPTPLKTAPARPAPQTGPRPVEQKKLSPPKSDPSSITPTPAPLRSPVNTSEIHSPAITTPVKRGGVVSATKNFLGGLLGSAIGLSVAAIGLLSFPLNVIMVMHFTGWSWFGSIVGVTVFSCIPVVGQIGYFVLAVMGAYQFWQADFNWRKVAYPAAQTFNVASLSMADLERFKTTVVRPALEKACKVEVLKSAGFDGKIPESVARKCECVAMEFTARLTRDDLIVYEKSGEYPVELQQRTAAEVRRACAT